jgi:hypothetical protein
LEAFAPRNPTLVTLIRKKKRFKEFSPNDVLGIILTHELMDKEIKHRKKICELEAKMNNLKVKDVALQTNKSSKHPTSSKHSTSSKLAKSKSKKIEVVGSSSESSDNEDEDSPVEIGDVAFFMRKYRTRLRKQGYKFTKRKYPNKEKRMCYNSGSTGHFIADCPNEKKEGKNDKGKGNYKKEQKPHHKRKNYGGEAQVGHEWNSSNERQNDEEEKKVTTLAVKKTSCTSKLFNNLTNDMELNHPLPHG